MAQIDWSAVSARVFEDMVSVLLSHIHPAATRVDGSDDGVDVKFVTPEGIHAYQLKYVRRAALPRTAIEDLVVQASRLNFLDWTLIAPTELSSEARAWFAGLKDGAEVPIDFRGRSWLEAQLDARPVIRRYFLEGGAAELSQMSDERSRSNELGTPANAVDLVERLNAIDPFYRYELTLADGARTITVLPRYRGAVVDHPIEGSFEFAFPNDDEGRAAEAVFRDALDFGTPAEVEGRYIQRVTMGFPVGLTGETTPTAISLGGAEGEADVAQELVLVCENPEGGRIADLPLSFTRSSGGARGSIWTAADATGVLSVRLKADVDSRTFKLTLRIRQVSEYLPHEMWPLVRFLAAMVKPNSVTLYNAAGDRIGGVTDGPDEPWVDPGMPRLLEDLVLIQAASGLIRSVPSDFKLDEAEAVAAAAELLRGGVVNGSWDRLVTTVAQDAPEAERAKLLHEETELTLITHEPHRVSYGGVDYVLQRRGRVTYSKAKLEGPARREPDGVHVDPVPQAWLDNGHVPAGVEIVFVPGADATARLALVTDVALEAQQLGAAGAPSTQVVHSTEAAVEETEPDWDELLRAVVELEAGIEEATAYHRAVEKLLTALLEPSLRSPHVEESVDGGQKRIDITYANTAVSGFFWYLTMQYRAPWVIVECKNYTRDLANPELDQMLGRFDANRGMFGMIVCRDFKDKDRFVERCRTAAAKGKGFILTLDDADLTRLVQDRKRGERPGDAEWLLERFRELVM